MAKNYIMLHYDFNEATQSLSDAECGRLVKAMVEYARGGEVPESALVGSERHIFPMFRLQIDRDNHAYEARVLQNAVNGRKGGRPRKDTGDENDEINPTVILETEKSQYKDKYKYKEKYKEKDTEKECGRGPPVCRGTSPAHPPEWDGFFLVSETRHENTLFA